MAKIRIYELAKELKTDNKTLEKVVRGLGIEIKNYMSTLTPEQAQRVRSQLGGGGVSESPDPAPARGGGAPKRRRAVIRRRAAGPRPAEKLEAEAEAEAAAASVGRTDGAPVRRAASEAASPRPVSSAAPADAAASDESPAGPAVGQRIALPKGTTRLRGGMAERLERERAARRSAGLPETREAREPSSLQPVAVEESAPEPAPTPAEDVAETPAAAEEAAAPPPPARGGVVRDERGVIVGVAPKKSGPDIQGFITLEPRRKQQVVITEAQQPRTKGRASQRKKREEKLQQQQRRRNLNQRNRRHSRDRGRPREVSTVAMSEEKKRIRVDEAIQVSDLAHQMSVRAPLVIKALWKMGMRGTVINSAIDVETAELVAAEFGYTVENVSFQEEALVGELPGEGEGELRAPDVTVMGHVDHGKTTLLDNIRRSRVAEGEAGGITQHVAAYRVETERGPVVFVDTPGHQAFSAMRERGASLTDIVVLIVAADDGVMPTTVEAIKYANAAGVPIIVAINKIDKPEANVGRVKQMLMEHQLIGEEFGGETSILQLSAKTGQGIPSLLEHLALQAELLDLRAPTEGRAAGLVIESRVDKGRGTMALVLVQRGTLCKGDILVAGEASGKVRGLLMDGKPIKEAGPSMPVEVLGLDGAPPAGESFHCVDTEKDAKQIVSHRREQRRRKESVRKGPSVLDRIRMKKVPVLKIVLRADVAGSAEALKETLEDLSTEKVRVEVIFNGVGAISENDVKLAHAGEAVIIGFNVKPVGKAASAADAEQVKVRTFSIIYEAAEAATEMMIDLLEPEYVERAQGEAEVRDLFPIPRLGIVCGSRIIKGMIARNSHIRVRREGRVIHTARVSSLRVFKDDVKEVKEGFECGIVVEGAEDVQPGDVLEAFELEPVRPSL
jgi:translation initiation factor IF-2